MKKAYHYFFYKIYKSLDSPTNEGFLIHWKAELILDVLGIFIGLSILNYYTALSGEYLKLNAKIIFIIYVICIAIPNYFIFRCKDQWKKIIQEFDKLPKNKLGGILTWGVIILIIANLIFSFSLLFDQAKKNHTGPYSPVYLEQQK